MEKKRGIHFYICITNYVDIIEDEQSKTNKLTHSIHALNSFFTLCERFATKNDAKIEKITGSRLHLYLEGSVTDNISKLFKISHYCYRISKILNTAPKYDSLMNLRINIGASFGRFFYHSFTNGGLNEGTSFGFACNFAAKLQSITPDNKISIDKAIFDELSSEDKELFLGNFNINFSKKYSNGYYYTANLSNISPLFYLREESNNKYEEEALEEIKKHNLGDIEIKVPREIVKFEYTQLTSVYMFEGIPLFADIRGFTSKFDSDDANLEMMASEAKKLLEYMHNTVKNNYGVHVQFQGDREFAIFNDIEKNSSIKNAVLAGLRLIDNLPFNNIQIGIGESKGKMFATTFGIRNAKDNIVLGKCVNVADRFEDDVANENELVIAKDIYDYLKTIDKTLANLFTYVNSECYKTKKGYKEYLSLSELNKLQRDKDSHNYNGAWSPLDD